MLVARVIFWTAMAAWGALELWASTARRGSGEEDRGSLRWSAGATLGGLAAVLVLDQVIPPVVDEDDQAPFILAGAGLVAAGVAFRAWSMATLGRFFTYQVTTTEDQQVVTGGPYRWLRHPSYTGLLVSCAGAGVATANPACLAVALVLPAVGITRRIAVEEAAMRRSLGAEYEDFAARRKRLVPGLW